MKSNGRPCPKCSGPSRTIETQPRTKFTYRRHLCRDPLCAYSWPSRQFDYVTHKPEEFRKHKPLKPSDVEAIVVKLLKSAS